MNERTIKVSNNRPRPMVVPIWPITRSSLTTIDAIVNANTKPAVRDDLAGTAHRADDARVYTGAELLFDPGHQQ